MFFCIADPDLRKCPAFLCCHLSVGLKVACKQALRGALVAGREKEGELATTSLEFEYLHRKSRCEMLIGGDDISNDVITLGTCFSMFVYIRARFLFALIGGNVTAQSTGSHRGIGGGISRPAFRAPRRSCWQAGLNGILNFDLLRRFAARKNSKLFSSTFVNICLVWCSIKIYRKYSEVRTTVTSLEKRTSRVSLRFLTVLLRLNNVQGTRCQLPLSSGPFLVQARTCDQDRVQQNFFCFPNGIPTEAIAWHTWPVSMPI